MHLYDLTIPSGNAYKISLLLSHLQIPHQTTSLDIFASPPETRTPSFLSINPAGCIPVLVLDDSTALAESNAILFYLAECTKYLPSTRRGRAQALQWLFFEQYSHEPYIAVFKACTYWFGFGERTEREKQALRTKGQEALDVMEAHLNGREWFVEEKYSVADIALFAYTRSAEGLGFEVGENVRAWLERVKRQEGWVDIKRDPTGKSPDV